MHPGRAPSISQRHDHARVTRTASGNKRSGTEEEDAKVHQDGEEGRVTQTPRNRPCVGVSEATHAA
jgi:hypothetical protein